MYTVIRSSDFDTWLAGLKDNVGKARIVSRIISAELGNLGDCEPVGDGVHEMRVHVGPGYRLYFTQRGRQVIFLLLGGDKSTQRRDIKRAKTIAKLIEEQP
jgi:putative addiction module killer protein